MNTVIEIIQSGLCSGCRACVQACPKQSIEMTPDAYGFAQPVVDEKTCLQCGECTRVCHVCSNVAATAKQAEICYAAYAKNKNASYLSASGGFATILGRQIILEGGIVFGCTMNERFETVHDVAFTLDDLQKFQGSKYIQSNTRDTFSHVKELLTGGRKVLYTGTPCQIAGLKCYLSREYSNLITLDIICHGVPSEIMLHQYIEWLQQKRDAEVRFIRFRNRDRYTVGGFTMKIEWSDGHIDRHRCADNLFYTYFSRGLNYRSSCYTCPYAQVKRVSDITCGDNGSNMKNGWRIYEPKSCVLINSQNGLDIWNKVRDELHYRELDTRIEVEMNPQLQHPVEYSEQREVICRMMANGEYDALQTEFDDYCSHRPKLSIFASVSKRIPLCLKKLVRAATNK